MTRFQRAFLLAPLTAPLSYGAVRLLEALADPARRPWALQNAGGGLGVIVAFGAPVAYGAALGVGLPALWLLRCIGPVTRWRVVIVGAVIGVAVAAVLTPYLRGELVSAPLGPWRGALLGATTAAVWGLLALGRDRRGLTKFTVAPRGNTTPTDRINHVNSGPASF